VNTVEGKELSISLQIRVITWVWGQQPSADGWVWMGWMDRGADGTKVAWRDRWFPREGKELSEDTISEISSFLHTRADKDIYFSPVIYARRGHRTKANTTPSRIVHADYDAVDPRGFSPALIPQLVWETSPGSWQGLHVLQEPLALEEWERLSRRLTRGLGADRGCWDMPHPIRVPGRRNYKPARIRQYGPQGAPGKFLRWKREEAVDPSERPEWLALPEPEELEAFSPESLLPMTSGEGKEASRGALESGRAKLAHGGMASVRAMLRDDEGMGDRSEHVHATAKELLKAGLDAAEAGAVMAADSATFREKYGSRRDLGGQVRREIEAALRSLATEGWTQGAPGEGLREPVANVELMAALTDHGNAARLIARWGAEIRWVDQWMTWMVWSPTEGIWKKDISREVRRRSIELSKDLMRSAADLEDGKHRGAILRWATHSLNAAATSNCLQQAQAFPGIVVEAQDLDDHPDLWVTRDGIVVDLRTGKERKAEPTDLITKRGGVGLDDAGGGRHSQPEKWLTFLTQTFGADKLELVQRLLGATMVGRAKKWFVVLQGVTDSGKSQFQHVVSGVFGDWSGSVKRDTFAYSRWEKTNQDGLANLAGVRFAMWSETKEGLRVDEALLKDLTDGVGLPKMVSRKYEKAWAMTPTMTLWMDTNHKPNLRHGDDALWNRVVLLHTLRRVPKSEQVEGLAETIVVEEGPAILRWALEGAKKWLTAGGGKTGLGLREKEEEEVKDWRGEQDQLGRWLDEVLEPGRPRRAEEAVTRKDLLDAWNEEIGGQVTPQAFGKDLMSRGLVRGPAREDEVKWRTKAGRPLRMLSDVRWAEGLEREQV
jgi:P4 family phage/plasmid primase-like protien